MKKILTTRVLLIVSVLFFPLFLLASTWTLPVSAPPDGNIPAPINIGSSSQEKAGPLWAYGLFSTGGGYFRNSIGIDLTGIYDDPSGAEGRDFMSFYTNANRESSGVSNQYVLSIQNNGVTFRSSALNWAPSDLNGRKGWFNGGLEVYQPNGGWGSGLRFTYPGGTKWWDLLTDNYGDRLVIGKNNGYQMVINNGNVGIGTGDPQAKLDVRGKVQGNISGGNPNLVGQYDVAGNMLGSQTTYAYDSLCAGNNMGDCSGAGGVKISTDKVTSPSYCFGNGNNPQNCISSWPSSGTSYWTDNGDNYWIRAKNNWSVYTPGQMQADNGIYTSNWFRSYGDTGWYSETHGGGWFMQDNSWVRTYGGKGVWTAGGLLGSDGGLTVGYGGGGTPSGGATIAGSVGIGTQNPGAKLEVNGDTKVDGILKFGNHSLNSSGDWLFLGDSTGNAYQGRGIALSNLFAAGNVAANSLKVSGGSPSVGNVLTAIDSNGNAAWKSPSSIAPKQCPSGQYIKSVNSDGTVTCSGLTITDYQCTQGGLWSGDVVCQMGAHAFCSLGEVHVDMDCDVDQNGDGTWKLSAGPGVSANHRKCDAWCIDF
jgi:hypothetical protein